MSGSPLGDWLKAPAQSVMQQLPVGAEVEFQRPYRHQGEVFAKGTVRYVDHERMRIVFTVDEGEPYHWEPDEDGELFLVSARPPRVVMVHLDTVEHFVKMPKPKTNADAFVEMMADAERDRKRNP